MAGALIQLVALGTQDTKLTKDAQISFFKSSYRPYVNFAMEAIENSFSGQADFGKRFVAELSRSGDLVLDFLMEMTLPNISIAQDNDSERVQWIDNIGDTMVKRVAINIGGQKIDEHFSEYFTIWNELTMPAAKKAGYNDLIGQQNLQEVKAQGASGVGQAYAGYPGTVVSVADPDVRSADADCRYSTAVTHKYDGLQTPKIKHCAQKVNFIPRFWFNENPGLALPLIALQYHQVKVEFELRPLTDLYVTTGDATSGPNGNNTALDIAETRASLVDLKLWVNYVFLEAAERRITAKKSHEYLITQVQSSDESVTASNSRIRLGFNHPCMELIWAVREENAAEAKEWTNFNTFDYDRGFYTTIPELNPFVSCKLQIHGQDRFTQRDGDYFTRYQPYKYHTRVPASKGICVYSFSLNPESKQPNGTANFSRIDQPILQVNFRQISSALTGKFFVYGRNVNLFRVAGGMGGKRCSTENVHAMPPRAISSTSQEGKIEDLRIASLLDSRSTFAECSGF